MNLRPAASVALLLLVAACGQRGDLFIPEPDREAIATVPVGAAAAPEPDAAEDEEEQRPAAPPPADSAPGR